MSDSTFKITLGALLVVYLLLFISVPATPWRKHLPSTWPRLFVWPCPWPIYTRPSKPVGGVDRVQSRIKFERNCILYAIAGIALKVISNSQFVT